MCVQGPVLGGGVSLAEREETVCVCVCVCVCVDGGRVLVIIALHASIHFSGGSRLVT